jgi:hypothetical protein
MVDLRAEIASTLLWLADTYEAGEADAEIRIADDAVYVCFRPRKPVAEQCGPAPDAPAGCAACGSTKPVIDVLDGQKMCTACGVTY